MPPRNSRATEAIDHDLLIKLDTKLEQVITDIKELKDNFASRVSILENEKVNEKEFEEFKKKVQPVVDNFYKIIGGLIVFQVIVWPVLFYLFTHQLLPVVK